MTQILLKQSQQIFAGQRSEKGIQTIGQRWARETSGGRALLEGEFSEEKIGLEPMAGEVAQGGQQTLGRTVGQVTLAIAFEGLAGLSDHGRTQRGFRRQIGQKI